MHLWEGLFRTQAADCPGTSRATPQLFASNPDAPRHAAGRTPGSSSITSNAMTANAQQIQQQYWSAMGATPGNSDVNGQYQWQCSRSPSDLAGATGSSNSSQPVQIPEAKVLPYSRLRASVSTSPSQTLLAGNESPGSEALLGTAAAAAVLPAAGTAAAAAAHTCSSGGSSSGQVQQQSNNLILRGQSRNKRPPPCPSPQVKTQHLGSTAASSSNSSNIPASPRRTSSSNAAWIASGQSSTNNITAYNSPVGTSGSAPWAGSCRVLGSPAGPGGLTGPGVSVSPYGGFGGASSGSRRHQQLLAPALQSASPSPAGEGLLASSLLMSPASATAAAAVGEAVAAVAGNPHHPHHQQTMQLLLQHQQLQLQQLQQQQAAATAADVAGGVGDGLLYPGGDYYGSLGAQQSPQSPRALFRRSSSSSRLAELGTSPGLIEASFMGLAARPRHMAHSNSFTAAASSSSSRRTALQQMQHADYLAARQQQQQQERVLGSRGSSAAGSPRVSQAGSGASLADWDRNNIVINTVSNSARQREAATARDEDLVAISDRCITPSTAAAAAATPHVPAISVKFSRDGSSSSLEQLLQGDYGAASSIPATDSGYRDPVAVSGQRGGLRVLKPNHNKQQEQPWGLGSSGATRHRSSGSLGEIEANDAGLDLSSAMLSTTDGASQAGLLQQQQQGFGGFRGDVTQRSASFSTLTATPAKIGEGPIAAAAAAGSLDMWAAAPATAGINDGSDSSQSSHRLSFKQAAAAIAAAAGTSPTSSAAATAASDELIMQDSFTSSRSVQSFHGSAAPESAAAAAAAYDQFQPGMSASISPRASSCTPAGGTAAAAAAARSLNSNGAYLSRSFSRRSNSSFGALVPRSGSMAGYPTCLICLDQLTPEDFENGEALQLDCRCKGEVALRHRQCAEKWSRIKGNTICDVCKAPILNLPDVPPLPVPPGQGTGNHAGALLGPGVESGLWGSEEPPAAADYIFDCIRVTWVVLIVSILFFEMSVTRAFLTGALMGSAYVALAASWSAAQRRRRQNRMAAAAAAAGWMGQQGTQDYRVPLLQGQVGGIEGLPV